VAAQQHIRYIFGTAPIGNWPAEQTKEFLSVLKTYKVNDLDTAKLYTGSEKKIT